MMFSCFYVKEVHIKSFSCPGTPSIKLREDLSFEVQLVRIVDQRMKVLRNKDILMVKVLWRSDRVEEMTWETKASMRNLYLFLFSN